MVVPRTDLGLGAQVDRRVDEVNLVSQRGEEPSARAQASFD
jgi:hypothetical protein